MLLSLTLAAAPALFAGDDVALTFDGLSIAAPPLEELALDPTKTEQLQGRWTGKLGDSSVDVSVFRVPRREYRLEAPEDVVELIELNVPQEHPSEFRFDEQTYASGDYGFAPYLAMASGVVRGKDGTRVSSIHIAAGITLDNGYTIEVAGTPPIDAAAAKSVAAYFEKGLEYEGDSWDPDWTDEEVEARWARDAPPELLDDLEVRRTKHYVILTNSSGGKLFSKKMEECYTTIGKVFPFDEVKGRRLMPIFLFRTPQQYYDYYVKIAGQTQEGAKRSKGHAWKDYYATWYEEPKDPVHIHEATHQIFANRLRLGGGGSWFQEGVAEYIETRKNERGIVARLVKKERHVRLPEFFQMRSLLYSSDANNVKGGSKAGDAYKQAALLIEFLRESKFGKKRFEEFIDTMGRVPRNNLELIDAALMKVYEVDSKQLDELFIEYCKKR